jgi:23S rRNA pseudouridine1911/1915/1917 synthase
MKLLKNTHIVPEEIEPLRLVEYLLQLEGDFLPGLPSRNHIKKLIKNGSLKINDNPASTGTIVCPGMKIELYEADQRPAKIYKLNFPVIYEDEFLAVINKPAGIVVSGNRFRTVENALLYNIQPSKEKDALVQPRPVHRLDALTSGLLLIAKTRSVRQILGEMFSNKDIVKTYRAIVVGSINESGKIEIQVNDQPAITEYSLIRTVPSLKCKWISLISLKPHTGRTHQLRIHLSKIGFPILGDKLYGDQNTLFKGKGLFLSAVGLKFCHPVAEEILDLKIKEPDKFRIHLERQERRYIKLGGI